VNRIDQETEKEARAHKGCRAIQEEEEDNPNFTRELEKEINGLRDKYQKTEFLLMGDMNCRIGMLLVDLLHSWNVLENVSK
jgi:hypothetical protein